MLFRSTFRSISVGRRRSGASMVNSQSKTFGAGLEVSGTDDIALSERQSVEKTLGKNAIKYQLKPGGFRELFKARAEEQALLTEKRG